MDIMRVDVVRAGYDESKETIRDIRFSVGRGEMVGLIGPNGAGKSTTIKAILGLLKHVEGRVEMVGANPHYAYIPEQPILYDEMTLWEHLELAAAAYEMDRSIFVERAERLLGQFRLMDVRHHFPTSFSKGMQQKIMLILGFLLEPDLYVVDEPFVGLDPRATRDFLSLLEAERQRGAGVLMSTHVLDTAEKICDSFILVDGGRIVAQGDLEGIRNESGMPGASLFDCFHHLT